MTTEHKVIGGIGILTLAIFAGGILLISGQQKADQQAIEKGDVIAENGLHWHPTVTVTLNGQKQPFQNGLGISGTVHNPIHTHDDADQDVVHMEFSGVVTKDDTKLSNFFKVWGKEFNSSKLFDKVNGNGGTVKMLVNGEENNDFENYQMRDKDKIEIIYE